MKVLPVLHIQNGRAVPGFGSADREGDPHAVLDRIAALGGPRLALVDLDAACGRGQNRHLVAGLCQRFRQLHPGACVQVGGGVRSSDQAQFFLDAGATWLLVGTVLHRYPAVVDQLMARFRDNLTAAIDASEGQVHASGWHEALDQRAELLAKRLGERGFRRLLFVDIPQEPALAPDFETARKVCAAARVPVFMGGSLRERCHLEAARGVRELQGVMVDAFHLQRMHDLVGLQAAGC